MSRRLNSCLIGSGDPSVCKNACHIDGRMGSGPAQASAEKGRDRVMMAAQALIREVEAFSRKPMAQ